MRLLQVLHIIYYNKNGSFNRSCMMCTLHLQQLSCTVAMHERQTQVHKEPQLWALMA